MSTLDRAPRRFVVFAATALLAAPVASAAGAASPVGTSIASVGDEIAPGVSIAGIDVSGLTRSEARSAVIRSHVVPRFRRLNLTFRGRRLSIDPRAVGYSVAIEPALEKALAVGRTAPLTRTDIPLDERVDVRKLRAVIRLRAASLRLGYADAQLTFRAGRPVVVPPRFGWVVDEPAAVDRLAQGLVNRRLASYPLPERRVVPGVARIGPVIVINRSTFTLTLYNGARATRRYRVAVGMPAYPTPAGRFRIIVKQRDPTWFPPNSQWAKGLGPKPPGPGNPLGTRWMGTSAPGIGIHGTPVPSSIGTRASHGCIRMKIPEAEELYEKIGVGTPVLIV